MLHLSAFVLRRAVAVVAAALLTTAAEAKIWRVDNNGGSPGNFTSAQAAHDAAAVVTNDTLYFNGSGTSYGSLTMTKRLYLFGPGYFLAQNPQTQAVSNTAYIDYLYINPGSSGSMVTGLEMFHCSINANNIVFKRNKVTRNGCAQAVMVGNSNAVSNLIFVQNWIENTGCTTGMQIWGGCSNVIVKNNWLRAVNTGNWGLYSDSNVDLGQNIIYGRLYTVNSTVYNNIMYDGGNVNGSGNSYLNNLGDGTQFPAGNGNQQNHAIASVIVNSGSTDGQYQLKAGSPAIGAGVTGEDIGMFGGSDPYKLSGLPAIPAIWFFSAPSSGSGAGGLQIQIKAKSHN